MGLHSKKQAAKHGGFLGQLRGSRYSIWAFGLFIFYWACVFLDTIKAWPRSAVPISQQQTHHSFTEPMVSYGPRIPPPARSDFYHHAREQYREDNRLHCD